MAREILCINNDQHGVVKERAREETPTQRAKHDTGSQQEKNVLAHMSGLNMEVAGAI